MKKEKDAALIIICLLFTVFLCGIFIGRATSRYPVELKSSDYNFAATESPSDNLFIGKKMNINAATVDDLKLIPSVGEKTAQDIVDYRTDHGAFQSLSELKNIDGLNSERILQLIDYITVGGTYEDIGR